MKKGIKERTWNPILEELIVVVDELSISSMALHTIILHNSNDKLMVEFLGFQN